MSDRKQVFKVLATPRQRFQMAVTLLHKDLKFKTRETERQLHRARVALGLVLPTEVYLEKRRVSATHAADRRTQHVFDVTVENAEFLIAQTEKLELNAVEALFLEPLLEQLDRVAKQDGLTEAPDDLPAYSEDLEAKAWLPSDRPILDQPDLLGELVASSSDWSDFQRRYAQACEPPEETAEPKPNGQPVASA